MSRKTFRAPVLVTSLVAVVFSFNLLVGAQDQTTGTGSNKQSDKNQQSDSKQKTSTQDMHKGHDKDMHAGMTGSGVLNDTDRKFITEAAHGGMMEVELGKMATQKAMSDDVKQFGQRMVDDHSKANDELMKLATDKGINLMDHPHSMAEGATASGTGSQMSGSDAKTSGTGTMSGHGSNASDDKSNMMKKHQEMMTKMSAMSGAEFDRKYMEHMVKDHEKDVAAFERESARGSDADVKAWAAKTLPTLREHLQMARDTEAKVKASSKGNMNKTSGTSSGSRPN